MADLKLPGFDTITAILRQIAGNIALISQALPVPLNSSVVWNPPSIASGASASTTVTVSGAALGQPVSASFSLDLMGLGISAYVSALNTVSVVLVNNTGAPVDLGSGTVFVKVWVT